MEWLGSTVHGLITLCVLVALTEAMTGDDAQIGGMRMICGLAVSLAVVRAVSAALGVFTG